MRIRGATGVSGGESRQSVLGDQDRFLFALVFSRGVMIGSMSIGVNNDFAVLFRGGKFSLIDCLPISTSTSGL